jgi:endoglucanase
VAGNRSAADIAAGRLDLYQQNYQGEEGMWCVGLNAVGFDLDPYGGRNGHYLIPDKEQILYFYNQGSNCFRLPAIWERLQSQLGTDVLDPVDGMRETVDFITKDLGAYVIIDPHNNDQGLRYNGRDATRAEFVDLWKAITKEWGNISKAIFGLYNEPRYGYEHGQDGYFDPDVQDKDGTVIKAWTEWMQEAIDAIRLLGSTNLILVPGLHWTTSRDWGGAGWWGETIDGVPNAGNTRLASLTDPANMIAYDIHQYMDPRFTGEQYGCEGHVKNAFGGLGADWGLTQTVAWAQKYNKKMMMTEIGSWPNDDGTNAACRANLYAYLQSMYESGVFLGYQVWQFGCPGCRADQWTLRPYNLDWYRFDDFGRNGTLSPGTQPICAKADENCLQSKCCSEVGLNCYQKDVYWASCMASCQPGVNTADPVEFQTPWSCTRLDR